MSAFIIAGRNMATMARTYYTGQAGRAWLSADRADAYTYETEEQAQRHERTLTRRARMAGVVLWTTHALDSDAHAAGARAMSEEACGS